MYTKLVEGPFIFVHKYHFIVFDKWNKRTLFYAGIYIRLRWLELFSSGLLASNNQRIFCIIIIFSYKFKCSFHYHSETTTTSKKQLHPTFHLQISQLEVKFGCVGISRFHILKRCENWFFSCVCRAKVYNPWQVVIFRLSHVVSTKLSIKLRIIH